MNHITMKDKFKTHYSNLQVTENASNEVIKGAYKYLTQKYHPDKNPDNEDSKKILQIITQAYNVLSNPEARKKHDEWIGLQRLKGVSTEANTQTETVAEAESEVKAGHYQNDYVVNDWSNKKEKPFNWENNGGDIVVIGLVILGILSYLFKQF